MSTYGDLFHDLVQFTNVIKTLLALYLTIPIGIVALTAMGYNTSSKPPSTEPEEAIVARIKANTVKLHPELYNVAVLAKRTAHAEQKKFDVRAAAISAFERPFNQSVLEYGECKRSPSRRAALEALDEVIEKDLRATEKMRLLTSL